MTRKLYDGRGITELRRWARDLGVAGRSTMTGDELSAACVAACRANVVAAEQAVLQVVDVVPGVLLRHKTTGTIVRVTSTPEAYIGEGGRNYESLCFTAEYVEVGASELHSNWTDGVELAQYWNSEDARRREWNEAGGHGIIGLRHMLHQYEAIVDEAPVEAAAPPARVELTEAEQAIGLVRGVGGGVYLTPSGSTEQAAAAPAPRVEVGSIVHRLGEDRPEDPRGEVVSIPAGERPSHVWVVFSGILPATFVALHRLRLADAPCCGQPWVAEIELCPRCQLSAARHPRRAAEVAPAAQGFEQDDRQRLDDLIEQVCSGMPESWDDEASADSIIVDYVREIERRLLAAGGSLEKWIGDE